MVRSKIFSRFLICVLSFLVICFSVFSLLPSPERSFSASAEEVTEEGTSRAASDIDLSKYPSANLIPFPYSEGTTTKNGVTFTVNDDGSVSINGTATAGIDFFLYREEATALLNPGTYTASINTISADIYIIATKNNSNWIIASSTPAYGDFNSGDTLQNIRLHVDNGTVINNVTVYPMFNQGSFAYPYQPYIPYLIDQSYQEGEQAGHESGYDEGYEAGYSEAADQLSNILITEGNSSYATPSGKVVDYQATSTSLTFDTMSGQNGDYEGTPSAPQVTLKLNNPVNVNSRYTITYDSLVGNCILSFYYRGYGQQLVSLPASSTPMTLDFSLPYSMDNLTVSSFHLIGWQDPLGFDFDENHYTTGGPCVVKNLKIYASYDSTTAYHSGYEQGHSAGYNEGYNVGEQAGYNKGVADSSDYSFLSLFTAIVDAPVRTFSSLLDFEIFGINVKGFALALLTVALIIAGFRLFSGMGSK